MKQKKRLYNKIKHFAGLFRLNSKNKIYFMIAFLAAIIILLFFLQLQKLQKISQEKTEEKIVVEEIKGSGFLVIETLPSNAEIFVDDVYKGVSPLTLNNVPVGEHKIAVKKEGYQNFIVKEKVEAGKRSFVNVDLDLILPAPSIEEKTEDKEIPAEATAEEEGKAEGGLKAYGTINIGESFLFYYDFSKEAFLYQRQVDSDTFSKRYAKHLTFTRLRTATIQTIDKGIADVKKDDCVDAKGQLAFLNSGQSLCVITIENEVAALGGSWDTTKNAVISWKMFD